MLWACEKFSDLTQVRRSYHCSSGYLYGALYTQLELQRRKRLYPWPVVIGLDEHYFRRGPGGFRQFVSIVVDFRNRRLMELQTFRRTLLRWRNEILVYFDTGLTNGRTEGFNNKAKLAKKRAYGPKRVRLNSFSPRPTVE